MCVSAPYCAKVSGVKFLCVYFAMLLPIARHSASESGTEAMHCTFRHAGSPLQTATVRTLASPDESPCKPICASFRTGGSFAPSRNVYRCYDALGSAQIEIISQFIQGIGFLAPLHHQPFQVERIFCKSGRCSSHPHKVSHTANVQPLRHISAP